MRNYLFIRENSEWGFSYVFESLAQNPRDVIALLPFEKEEAANVYRTTWKALEPDWRAKSSLLGRRFFMHKPASCHRPTSTAAKLDWTAGFSSNYEKKGEERGEYRNYPRSDPGILVVDVKSQREGTLKSIDIQSAFMEEPFPVSGTLFNPYQSIFNQSHHCSNIKSMKEIASMLSSYAISLTCLLLKALLAYSLVLPSNLSCVQRTYVGLWRPNEHCDYWVLLAIIPRERELRRRQRY